MKAKLKPVRIPAAHSKDPNRVVLYIEHIVKPGKKVQKKLNDIVSKQVRGIVEWKGNAFVFDETGAIYFPPHSQRYGALELDELDEKLSELNEYVQNKIADKTNQEA